MAAQNEPNFALFTSSDLDFLTDELFTEMDFLTEQTETSETVNVSLVLCMSSRAYYAIDTMQDGFRKLTAKILENGGIINPLFDGLTYNTSGHFAHCS